MTIALVVGSGPNLHETLLSAEEFLPEFERSFMPGDEPDVEGVSWVFFLPAGWVLTQVVPLEKMRRVLSRDDGLSAIALCGGYEEGVEKSDQCGTWTEYEGVIGVKPHLRPVERHPADRFAVWGRKTDEPRARLL